MNPEDATPRRSTTVLQDRDHELSAYLLQGAGDARPVVHIKVGRNPVLHLSLEEARLMRDFIDALLSVDPGERIP